MTTYARLPVCFSHGKGAQVWDNDGKQYLDALCGIAVTGLGHAHPAVTQALCDQAGKLIHSSNLYTVQHQQALADALIAKSGMDNVFFSNSGAEANEAAIKLARLFGHSKDIDQPAIVVMKNSFHGRTLATLSATGTRKVQAGFEPLVSGFIRVPYNDLDAINSIASHNKNVVAVLVEPVQGEGGIQIPAPGYLQGIREICDAHGWLMMLDEIQTGMGRSGKWFCFQHEGIQPDVMTLAKALGNGMPIGACLAHGKAAQLFQPGNHGSTFGGNPLACRSGLAVVEAIDTEGLVERAAELGKRILSGLQNNLATHENVAAIRGFGLLLGIELKHPCAELVKQGLELGILINVTANNVIRLLPPLVLSNDEADLIVEKVSLLVSQFSPPAAR